MQGPTGTFLDIVTRTLPFGNRSRVPLPPVSPCATAQKCLILKGMPTPEEIADLMMAEILYDVSTGIIPRTVRSFSELHDYVDANLYGDTEKLLEQLDAAQPDTDEGHTTALNAACDLLNPAIETVDAWLANGGILRGKPRQTGR